MKVSDVRFVKELYPRLREDDAAIERYRLALDKLPPIIVARDGVLVDGFHRWQAHRREGADEIQAENLGNLSDTEILNESIKRNAAHGQQLSMKDKKALALRKWPTTAHQPKAERFNDIAKLLSVSWMAVRDWTKDARKAEKDELKAKVWDLHLDCLNSTDISKTIGVPRQTVDDWIAENYKSVDFGTFPGAPGRKPEPFDVWNFQKDDDDEKVTYFGKTPRQVLENLLWFYTEPGQIVVDPFAGSGTTINVAKAMGRRVWSSDIRPMDRVGITIHEHDIGSGWPKDGPKKADLVYLDPPYYGQAKGRYPEHEKQAGDIEDYAQWLKWWAGVANTCAKKTTYLAFIVSPTKVPNGGGETIDLALDMRDAVLAAGMKPVRRVVIPYTTQQATGDQVNKAREAKQMLIRVRDLLVFQS